LVTVCSALARWLRRYGYWPRRPELAEYLRADYPATADALKDLVARRQVELIPNHGGHARYRLTTAGWNLLGVVPIEPWRKPPNKNLIRRAVNAAARRVMLAEQRARQAAEAEQAVIYPGGNVTRHAGRAAMIGIDATGYNLLVIDGILSEGHLS
jgi:hypothetical protein